jgi:APA family basic amino acid/polyamine antiporter
VRIKPIEDVIAEGRDGGGDERLRRKLGPVDLIGFGIGIVIGTGLFTLTGAEARDNAGPAVVVSFAIAALVSMLAALCYAELASSVPTAGSAYTYAYATLGETIAWIIGWDLVLEFALGAAVVARSWSGHMAELLRLPVTWFSGERTVNLGAIAIAFALGVAATIGIRLSSWVTNVLAAVKVAICLLVIVAGAFYIRTANLKPFVPPPKPVQHGEQSRPLFQVVLGAQPSTFGIAGVLTATAVVFFAYLGFEAVANLGEETRNPESALPLGILGTLAIAMVLYVGVSFVVVGMANYREIDPEAPIASALSIVGLGWASALVSIAVVVALTGVILVALVAISRIVYSMARDGLLPAVFGVIHPRWGTPYRATAVITAGVALLSGFVPLSALADLVSIGALLAFLIIALAIPVLRRTRSELKRPFRVPLSPVLPVVSALASLGLMTSLTVETWLRFLAWLLTGVVIYLLYGRRHSRVARVDQGPPQGR